MPLGKNVRYRQKGDVRLAFRGNKVIETKNMKTGAMHTPSEFAADRRKAMRHGAPDCTHCGTKHPTGEHRM